MEIGLRRLAASAPPTTATPAPSVAAATAATSVVVEKKIRTEAEQKAADVTNYIDLLSQWKFDEIANFRAHHYASSASTASNSRYYSPDIPDLIDSPIILTPRYQ
jgi:hypothetical protein